MFVFNKKYFYLSCFLFVIEVFIALYLYDRIIRPYIGDLLVVIMIYCFLMAFHKGSVTITALSVLLFAYIVETSQYFKLINYLGLQNSKPAKIILGSSFEWIDMIAYSLGITIVLCAEKYKTRRKVNSIIKEMA